MTLTTLLPKHMIDALADGDHDRNKIEVLAVIRMLNGGTLVHYTRTWSADWIQAGHPQQEERAAMFNAEGRFRSGLLAESK